MDLKRNLNPNLWFHSCTCASDRWPMMTTMPPALPNLSLSSFAVDSDVSFGREMRKDPEIDCEDDDIRVRRPVRALSSPTGPHLSITHMVDGTAISTDTRAATQ